MTDFSFERIPSYLSPSNQYAKRACSIHARFAIYKCAYFAAFLKTPVLPRTHRPKKSDFEVMLEVLQPWLYDLVDEMIILNAALAYDKNSQHLFLAGIVH